MRSKISSVFLSFFRSLAGPVVASFDRSIEFRQRNSLYTLAVQVSESGLLPYDYVILRGYGDRSSVFLVFIVDFCYRNWIHITDRQIC